MFSSRFSVAKGDFGALAWAMVANGAASVPGLRSDPAGEDDPELLPTHTTLVAPGAASLGERIPPRELCSGALPAASCLPLGASRGKPWSVYVNNEGVGGVGWAAGWDAVDAPSCPASCRNGAPAALLLPVVLAGVVHVLPVASRPSATATAASALEFSPRSGCTCFPNT